MSNQKGSSIIEVGLKMALMMISIILIAIYAYSAIDNLTSIDKVWVKIIVIIQVAIESIIIFQAILITIGIFDVIKEDVSHFETPETLEKYPELDVFVPIRRVKLDILELTIKALVDQNYQKDKLNIHILDDTPEKELAESYKNLSIKYGVNYIYDPSNVKFKAGMMNIALKQVNAEYIAFFDFDQIPQPGILTHMVYLLQNNPQYAFVQTKKTFRELTNISRVWSALLYLQFFEVFERAKNKNKAVMFAGSTACFKRKYIDLIGGIPEETFTEDNYTTVKLLLEGQIGLFSDRVGSIGLVPNGFAAQISQLWRWSHGGTHTIKLNLRKILASNKLDWTQKNEIISMMMITPLLVVVYLYTISFVPIFLAGYDSPRLILGDVSSIFLIPIIIAFIYVVYAFLAIYFDRNNPYSEFKFRHLPGFLIIALAGNFLITTSGLTGMLGVLGPNSKRGQWNRNIPIIELGIFSFLVGIILVYYSYLWLIAGYKAAILLLIIAFSLIPTIIVVMLYKKPIKVN
ncbi:MAG: glycosyltransferase [Candidatus Heimdallarchaeota archaeon]|nr:glycosyltransferase [Candidatus Heimdallarchaeota archaeon]